MSNSTFVRIFAPQTRHHFRFCQRQQKYLQILKLNQNIFKYWAGKQCCPAHLCHWSKSSTERAKRISSEPSFLCFHLLPLSTTAAYLEASLITNLPKCLRNPLMFANDIFAIMYHDCHSYRYNCAHATCHQKLPHKGWSPKIPVKMSTIISSNDNLPIREMGCGKFKVQQIKIPGVYNNTIFSFYFLGGFGFPHVF